ncbi:hypothetical protein [Salinispora arenicola]|uniref:hypothetical protein n=1 Tax=Salinispora arenicola TaxID=168697 RepID=UPI000484C258|nr:hypothetical protein [Salinispora arenicola]
MEVPVVRRVTASVVGVIVGLAATWLIVVAVQGRPTPDTVWGPRPPTPAAHQTVFGVVSLMWSAGCEGGQVIAEEPGVHEVGVCTIDGHEVAAAVFADEGERDEWVSHMAGIGSVTATGSRWAVAGDEAAGVEAFAAAVPR